MTACHVPSPTIRSLLRYSTPDDSALMCTLALAYRAHGKYPLVLASNRDEFFGRPAAAAAFWRERPSMLAGRDLRSGGTWLGVALDGRFGVITNVRDARGELTDAPSRGEIIPEYLAQQDDAERFAHRLARHADRYNGFNLLVGDASTLMYVSNRDGAPRKLSPGVYGLSNAPLGTTWPKVKRAEEILAELLAADQIEPSALLTLLSDAERPSDELLPDTGVGLEWERLLSSIFIQTSDYGTCASTAFLVESSGRATFVERRTAPDAGGAERRFFFLLDV